MDHAARAKKALEGLIYSPKAGSDAARDIANGGTSAAGAPADAALFSMLLDSQNATDEGAPKARPWERSDLVRRLRSFRPATWFCKPAPAGPIECARRGWVNSGQDLLSCEFCKAKLAFLLPVNLSREETTKATTTFVAQLASEHAGDCPWQTAACAPELAAFPALPAETVQTEFAARCAALAVLDQIPPIAPAALAAIAVSHGPQLEALLADGPQQAQPFSGVGSEAPAQRSLDPEPDTPPAPPPGTPGGGAATAPQQQNGGDATPAQAGQADGSSLTGVLTDEAAAGSQEFARRQRLLALLGWHAVPVPFGVAPAAERRSGAASTDAGSTPPAQQVSKDRLPAGQAVIICRMCGAKHGMWSFLGAGGPDLSAARRPRPPAPSPANGAPGTRGGLRPRPGQGSAATPASAPASMQANGGSGATPVAWRGFGSPQQPAAMGGSGRCAQHPQLLGTTIAGGRLGGLTPGAGAKGGPFGAKGSPSGGGGTPSDGTAGASAAPPPAPIGSSSKAAPVFGTPALAARTPRQPAAPTAPAATIAGGVLTPATTPGKASDTPAAAEDAIQQQPQQQQQQQQQQQPSGDASGSLPSPNGSTPATNGSGSAQPAAGAAPAAAAGQGAGQRPAASPFGGGGAAAPVFGIAAMRSVSFGTPRTRMAATPKRSREDADGAVSEDTALPKRPKTSRGLQNSAGEAAAASDGAQAGGGSQQQPDGAEAAQQPKSGPADREATATAAAAEVAAPASAAPAAQPAPLDPLKLHRPFCPWVQWHEAGGARRCGWSWCIDALVPKAADASAAGAPADAEGQPRDRASLVMSLLKRVGVRR